MQNKPVKHGMKVWMCAGSHNGYVSKFQVYFAKTGNSEKGLGSRVVKHLKLLTNIIIVTLIISSLALCYFIELHEIGLYGCSTMQMNHKRFPNELKRFSERGERMVLQSQQYSNLTACV